MHVYVCMDGNNTETHVPCGNLHTFTLITTYVCIYRQTDRRTDGQTDTQTAGQKDREIIEKGRLKDRQTDDHEGQTDSRS